MKLRSDIHVERKIWHATMVLLMTLVYVKVDRKTALLIISLGMLFFTSADMLRLRWPWLNRVFLLVFHRVMRKHEAHGLAGTTFLLTGVFFSIFLFHKDVVTITLLFLALGDPIASYFGIRYGKDRIVKNKSLQGTLAAFLCCTVIAFAYFSFHKLMMDRIVLVSLVSGLIGALSEMLPVGKLDDNLTFPIICSTGVWMVFKVFM
ncbi:MAG: hypothetical protein SGJ18_00520 [Pseudomonadota bacterium]|nr:hypothetical protein [Pseudomonadota bacterium]